MRRSIVALTFAVALVATDRVSVAEGVPPLPHSAARVAATQSTMQPMVNCTCRFSGRDYHIGDTACIRGAIATCTTFLNNTSWTMSKSPCPTSMLEAVGRGKSG